MRSDNYLPSSSPCPLLSDMKETGSVLISDRQCTVEGGHSRVTQESLYTHHPARTLSAARTKLTAPQYCSPLFPLLYPSGIFIVVNKRVCTKIGLPVFFQLCRGEWSGGCHLVLWMTAIGEERCHS